MLVVHVEEWLFTPSVRLMLRPSQCSWRGLRYGADVSTFRGLVLARVRNVQGTCAMPSGHHY
jgi:hypothetical protein